ncbi:MAG: maleylpyruvate isomerase N-terminal domain-containing protein [Chloroflexi bacterium]|nr:maleylpyruvate isomerase N-terminal domain-containing protein [Chloroflexota bacterium]
MPASKQEIIESIRRWQGELETTVAAVDQGSWSKGVYEQGWNAKQLLCHLASDTGVVGFLINMASVPPGAGGGGGFDIDAFNAREVAARQQKTVAELVAERRSGCERAVEQVQATSSDVLARQIRVPWGDEGPLADIIVRSVQGHTGQHLADLRAAAG